jgi:hypothetical protein
MDSTFCKPGDEKFEAAWNPEEGEVTVILNRWAGICGPAGSYPATSLAEAATALFAAGYLIGGTWEKTRYSDTQYVPLTRLS